MVVELTAALEKATNNADKRKLKIDLKIAETAVTDIEARLTQEKETLLEKQEAFAFREEEIAFVTQMEAIYAEIDVIDLGL